jgi:hypothetical protein
VFIIAATMIETVIGPRFGKTAEATIDPPSRCSVHDDRRRSAWRAVLRNL